MRGMNLRVLMVASAMLTAACATHHELMVGVEQPLLAMTNLLAESVPRIEPQDPLLAAERGPKQLPLAEPRLPDVGGRWKGSWTGLGVLERRSSRAQAEFTQTGRWGWGRISLADTLAKDVPEIVTHRGSLGVPVVFDVSQSAVVVQHEVGGSHLTAVFKVEGDRMVGILRGYDTLIVLTRQR